MANKPFDPLNQFAQALAEVDIKLREAAAAIERAGWLRSRIAEDFAELERRAETFETFTEEQAAAMFQIKLDLLETLRRRHALPHVKAGKFVRYTREQLAAVADALTMNKRQKSEVRSQKTALRAA